jgi:hypothetical protein
MSLTKRAEVKVRSGGVEVPAVFGVCSASPTRGVVVGVGTSFTDQQGPCDLTSACV